MTETLRLHYYSDPMCSWCWGFAPVIEELQSRYAGRLALQLHAGGLRNGNSRLMTAQIRTEIQQHWQQVIATTGQPITLTDALPDGFIYDTEPANRALISVRRLAPRKALNFLHAMQKAFYVERKDITQASILQTIATTQGIDPAAFQQAFDNNRQTTAEECEARWEAGVSGFPTLLLQLPERRRIVSVGYQPLEATCARLDSLL